MKRIIGVIACVLMLSACGGGHKADLLKACTKDGEDKKICNCLIDELEKGVDKKTFETLAKQSKNDGMDKAASNLPADKQMGLVVVMMGAAGKCSK